MSLDDALSEEEPLKITQEADKESLEKLLLAEEIFEKRFQRLRRRSRIAIASQALVGYVALAGFFANAYQNYLNKIEAQHRAESDEQRWKSEFKRAQDADRYRAFFETSALVTDPNQSKRLVGYALLKEFVDDKDYNAKATLMLEEALAQELRSDTSAHGLDEAHRASVKAILSALAQGSDCKSLERASRTVEKLVQNNAVSNDLEETQEVFRVYVHRVFGRGVQICPNLKELQRVRNPIRESLIRQPLLGGSKTRLTVAAANEALAVLLRDECQEEMQSSGISDCPEIWSRYKSLCDKPEGEDAKACQVVAQTTMAAPSAASAPVP